MYYHGRTYTKSRKVIQVLKDQQDRGWRQEAARRGERAENLGPIRHFASQGLHYA